MKEEWRPVIGYEGIYEVSSFGRIKSVERDIQKGNVVQHRREKIKSQRKNADGYVEVKLSKCGVDKIHRVHRIVAESFLGQNDVGEVNHIDLNRSNNHVENLEWCTHRENISHSAALGRYKNKNGINNPNYGNTTLHERYIENPSLKVLQSRPGAKNGRSVPVDAVLKDGTEIHFDYIAQCAEWLISNYMPDANIANVAIQITKHIRSNKPYKGFVFKYR